ncbi:MAG: lysophospholipid acyltransferase family protein [Fimbriimonadales bacterium]|nr:lysophospholipid acyltransferase family protein [Fimbriimonadales bacterium]MDW8051403.1 lysophospholipid acyltransferase family protein [Armatimonadota bacterium]
MVERSEQDKRRARRLGALGYLLVRTIGSTIRLYVEGWEQIEAHRRAGTGAVMVSWHGRTLIPANFMRGMGILAMISLSRDGDIQNEIFTRLGFRTLRGSTSRGGVRAALEAAREVKKGAILAFTPDGPRGPSRKFQPGALLIAQKANAPIYPAGISAYPRILLPTWDRYLIPLPFARGAFLIGEPVWVPTEADKDDFARLAEQLEAAINALEARAEAIVRGRT